MTGKVVGLVAGLSLGLAACAGSAEGPVLTSQRELFSGDGAAALVQGTLDWDGECLRLVGDELADGPRYPVVWPAGTRWQAEPPAVVLSGGDVVPLGEGVNGGGGYVQAEDLPPAIDDDVAAAARECVGETGEVAFFNPGSRVEPSPSE